MPDLPAGSVFSGYRIEDVAGQGGMGVVYRATQIALRRPVALKLIVPELADDVGFRARFERESYLAAAIDHPNVVPIYEAGEAGGRLFISMRWVEGTDLRSLIAREGRLDTPRSVATIEQIAAALDAAHAAGLVHRDVKPANILLAAGGHAYLTDFGLTKRTSSAGGLTKTGQFVGTLDYTPPEQIQGLHADARADVYSLGCVLFNALTGRVPYERDSDAAKLYAHLSDPPPSAAEVAGVPRAFDPVVARALAKEPGDRYPSAGDLGRAARAAASETTPSQPERSLGTGPASVAGAGQPAPTVPAPGIGQAGTAAAPGIGQAETAAAGTGAAPAARTAAPSTAPPIEAATTAALDAASEAQRSDAPARDMGADLPGARPGPPSRRRPILFAVVAVAAVAGLLALTGALGGDGEPASGRGEDAQRGAGPPQVVATIAAGDGPDAVAVGNGSAWVSNANADALTRIDIDTDEPIGDSIAVGGNPDGVAVRDGLVWVANTDDGTVTRIDIASGERAEIPVGAEPEGVALGDGVLWVANSGDDSVTVIDRRLGRVVARSGPPSGGAPPIGVGRKPIGIFAGERFVWVTNSLSRSVSRIDQRTWRTVGEPTTVGRNPRAVIEAFGSVWVSNTGDDTVTRLDPDSGRVRGRPIPVGERPKDMAALDGSLWVVNEDGSSVSRIDPQSGRVSGDPVRVGTRPIGIAAGAGSLWVTNFGDDTVSRIDP